MNESARLTATLLIAAFVIFLVGAGFWLVREFEQPLEPKLRAVAAHRRRWVWIHSWMVAGTITSVAAVTLLVRLLKGDGGGSLATTALAFFAFGCAGFLVSLAVGLTATPKAAVASTHTGVVPPAYLPVHRLAGALYVGHMLLSYLAFALLGGAMLHGSLFPSWLAWFGIVSGCLGVVGFMLMRGGPFGPPIIAHSYGLLVGVLLLIDG